ncbi:F-box/LRR-repeat protein 17 [Spea bombifrons]|uniref:F-box/LRR-repeat protein 17 n=1 Tax=Spea bombifrons TaxID=233779 RepID=UPI0023498945|nr:F-box/LRR-repeat protein 17 [Spea bombifrons]
MGGLFCKQRSGQSPVNADSRKKKPHGDCFLRGPCMLCFIVHSNPRDPRHSRVASPELPAARSAAQDCARLLLLCPGELSTLEQRGRSLLRAGFLRGPGLLCTVSSQRARADSQAVDMVCKRKSSSGSQQPRTPCKLPRCTSAEEEPCCPCSPSSDCSSSPRAQSPALVAQDSCSSEPEPLAQEAESDTVALHINQLPPSLLLKIFSNISLNERSLSVSLVCKYWRDLCLDFHFWKQLDLSSRQQVKDDILERITSRYPNLTEINISDCLNISDTGVCKLALKCQGLLKYTAYRCKQLSDASLITLASHCPSLRKVHVGNQDRLTDEALKQLGTKCRELKDIHFGQCYNISDEGLIPIARGSPKLQRIYMQENKLVSDESVKAFAEHCPGLQYVGFMGCSVTSEGVIHLTKLRHLASLDLRHITKLDNETVMEIVRRCHSLTSLNLCLNRSINDRCVEVIAKEGWNLKELYLVTCKITDDALIAIGRYSATIETVDVGWCKEITDRGATLIAQSSKSILYLGLMRCDKVNEATVEQLVQQYPHITFSTVLQDCKRTLERAYQMGWTPNASSAS